MIGRILIIHHIHLGFGMEGNGVNGNECVDEIEKDVG